jgi:hypothetical protein
MLSSLILQHLLSFSLILLSRLRRPVVYKIDNFFKLQAHFNVRIAQQRQQSSLPALTRSARHFRLRLTNRPEDLLCSGWLKNGLSVG